MVYIRIHKNKLEICIVVLQGETPLISYIIHIYVFCHEKFISKCYTKISFDLLAHMESVPMDVMFILVYIDLCIGYC